MLKELNNKVPIETIINAVATDSLVDTGSLHCKQKLGQQTENIPRKFAMYCCQNICRFKLEEIKQTFNLNHLGSVSRAINDVKSKTLNNQLQRKFEAALKTLDVKQ